MKKILLLLILGATLWGGQPIHISKHTNSSLKIALMVAPNVVGRYAQSTYNVALATLMATKEPFELVKYSMKDESETSIEETLNRINHDGMDGILAPLTLGGVKNFIKYGVQKPVFIPTVHKRDIGTVSDNIIFGSIDYEAQIDTLLPYSASSLAIFYDDSSVGSNLSSLTQNSAAMAKKAKSSTLYVIDKEGSNIVKYLNKPALFSKKSIFVHTPVVKTSMLCAHLTFRDAHEYNILSTQINFDPTLISLTQYKDRRNMLVANSIVEQVPAIYETNALMNNDLTFDWINYTTSVGSDYLISVLTNSPRNYSLPILDSQVVYPVEIMIPKESGFEPKP